MTLAEFLVWDDGTDTRYELINGRPRAMAPAYPRHGLVQQNAARAIERQIGVDGPCRVFGQTGVVVSMRGDDRYYIPDLAMSCEDLGDDLYLRQPRLIVEVISPSTGRTDKDLKVPDYCSLPSVEEIWLVESRKAVMIVWQRLDGKWIGSLPLRPDQTFESRLLGGEIAVDDIFVGTGLIEPQTLVDQTSTGQS